MVEEKCKYNLENPIFNVIMKNRLFTKLYVFIGNYRTDKIKKICEKISNKERLTKPELSDLKKIYTDVNLWLKCMKYEVHFIEDEIYLDDTVIMIRKKIFYYLSNLNENNLFIENNQQLWVINKDPSKDRYGCEVDIPLKYIPLGYYYKDYEYTPSVYNKIEIDYKNFVDDLGISLNKYQLNNNLNHILYHIVDYTCVKNNIIFVDNLEIEKEFLKKEKIPINNIFLNGYIYKYWPKGKMDYEVNYYKDKIENLKISLDYERFIFNLIYNKNIENKYLGNCNIVSVRIRANYCEKILYKQDLAMDRYIDLIKIFNQLDVSEKIPFIKYKQKIEWPSPLFKISKDVIDKKIISKKKLLDWLETSPRGLLIKLYSYTMDGVAKYTSINIYPTGTVEVNLSFDEKCHATFDNVDKILKSVDKLIQFINVSIIDNKKQALITPSINKTKNMIKEGHKTKILFINMVIPIVGKINFDDLKIISEKFSPLIIKSLEDLRDFKYRFKYKRRSNFKNLNHIFELISEKKEDGLDEREIKIFLKETYHRDLDEINELMDMWKRVVYSDFEHNVKQAGAAIMIPKSGDKIKIYGVNNAIEIYSIYKLMLVIFDIINNGKDYFKNKEFKKFFNDEKYLQTLEEEEEEDENINLKKFENINLSKFINVKNYIDNNITINNKKNSNVKKEEIESKISDESSDRPCFKITMFNKWN